jgi:hypothetical protein
VANTITGAAATGFSVIANGVTTGAGVDFDFNGLTSGTGFNISTSSASLTSANLMVGQITSTYTSTTALAAARGIDFRRTLTSDGGATTVSLDANSDVMLLTSNITLANGGAATDASNVLELIQNFSTATGEVLKITNSGTGSAIGITSNTTSTGDVIDITALGLSTGNGIQVTVDDTLASSGSGIQIDYETVSPDVGDTLFDIQSDQPGNDTSIFRVSANGDTNIQGDLNLDFNNGATTNGVCHSGADADASATDRDLVVCSAAPDDYAEWYETESNVDHGELVAFSAASFTYQASQSNPFTGEILPDRISRTLPVLKQAVVGDTVFGVVSTSPNQTIGSDVKNQGAHPMPIALNGRVPMKVSDENGAIEVGDYLTLSSIPGHAMKATDAGQVVGRALEVFVGPGTGTIVAFIDHGFYVGGILADDGTATAVSSDLVLNSLGEADATTTGVDSHTFTLRGSGWDGEAAQNVEMKLVTDVTDATDYRLSIKNTSDAEVAYVNEEGDLAIAGRLYPSDRGALQTSKYIYYDGDTGLGGDFMRTNASGWATGSYDFAEMFPSGETLMAGDVVVFATQDEHVARSHAAYDMKVAGIVSTRPGFLAGENRDGDYPVALAGRVPTKVNTENGPIAIGDPLTTSSTAGYAMRATEPGPIVGYALEPFDGAKSADDKIIAFVNVSWYGGEPTSTTPGVMNVASTISTGGTANFTQLNMDGTIYMNTHDIVGVRRLAGISDRWVIEEDGTFKTDAVLKTVVTTYQNERVETAAVTSTDVMITLVGTSELEDGRAIIRFEDVSPTFNDITSTIAPIRVIVTPNGPVSLYATEKSNDGFVVQQIDGAASGVTFDWMASAYRKDYEPAETLEIEEAEGAEGTGAAQEPAVIPSEGQAEPTQNDSAVSEEPEMMADPAEPMVTEEPTEPVTEPIAEPAQEPAVIDDPAASPTEPSDSSVATDGGESAEPVPAG